MRVNSEYASEILENIAKLKDESEKVTLIAGQDQQRWYSISLWRFDFIAIWPVEYF